MVVKPAANLTRGAKGLVQPGLKVRGREYLRLIYGPDYTEPANLTRLRQRALSPQALAGAARVRPRPGGPGPGGPRRAAVARARVRLRRPGPGIRTRRPAALAMTIIAVPYHLDEYLPDLDLPCEPDEVVTVRFPPGDPWERLAVL